MITSSVLCACLLISSTDSFVPRANVHSTAQMRSTTTNENDVIITSASFDSRTAKTIGETCEAGGTILDEDEMLKQQSFEISPDELVTLAKQALRKDSGVLDASLWADDFEFVAPVIGPLPKEEFLDAAQGFNVYDAFPDFDNRYFGFTVDPLEPGRVWFFTRLRASNTGGPLLGQEATQKTVELPPQVFSFLFNSEGLVRELTVGYAADRRQGDTGGLGGMFGLFYGAGRGLPFPEAQPYKKSKRFQLFQTVSGFLGKLSSGKKDETV